tara:strand:+ start:102 stop:413 length:312 start_codon:yes stop_codon:yes gene_type:complete
MLNLPGDLHRYDVTKQDFQQHILEHDIPTRAKDFGQKPLEQVDTAGGAIIRVLHGINNNSIVELLILEFHTDGSVKGEFFRRYRGAFQFIILESLKPSIDGCF